MFLHLGGEIVVRAEDVIAILNVEKNRSWYRSLPKGVQAKVVEPDRSGAREGVKAVVITGGAVYYSSISSGTLKKRAEQVFNHGG